MTARRRSTSRCGGPTSRSPRRARTRSRAASSSRYLVLASAGSPPAASASRCGRRCARSTPARRGAIVPLERRRRRAPPTCSATRRTTTRRSSSTCPAASCAPSARSARTSAASSTTRPAAEQDGLPVPRGRLRRRRGGVISGPPQRPLGRIDVEVRDGTVWALANVGEAAHRLMASPTTARRPRRVARDVPVALGVFVGVLLVAADVPPHGRGRRAARRRRRLAWTTAGFSVLLAAGSAAFYRYLR